MQTQAPNFTNPNPQWPALIKEIRSLLGESQTVFGQRFNVSHVAVGKWESGTFDPPAHVLWWALHQTEVECRMTGSDGEE